MLYVWGFFGSTTIFITTKVSFKIVNIGASVIPEFLYQLQDNTFLDTFEED